MGGSGEIPRQEKKGLGIKMSVNKYFTFPGFPPIPELTFTR